MFAENVKATRIIERMNNLEMAILLFLLVVLKKNAKNERKVMAVGVSMHA